VEDFKRFLRTLRLIEVQPTELPEYRRALAIERVLAGESAEAAARDLKIAPAWLAARARAVEQLGLPALISGIADLTAEARLRDRRLGIAQILLD